MIRRKFLGAILGAAAAPKVLSPLTPSLVSIKEELGKIPAWTTPYLDVDIYARILGEYAARDIDMKMRWMVQTDHLSPRFTGTIEGVRF